MPTGFGVDVIDTASCATVKTHVNRIFSKLQLRDRVHAVILGHKLRT